MLRVAIRRTERENYSADRRTARICAVIASAFFRKEGGFSELDFMPDQPKKERKPKKGMTYEEMAQFMEWHNKRVRKRA